MSEQINKVLYNVDQTSATTEAQKAQARANIGVEALPSKTGHAGEVLAVNSTATGLEWVDKAATQEQANWAETNPNSVQFIQNKPDMSTFATQADLAGKQDTLTAGQNINISNNVISATAAPQEQADWAETDSSAVDYIKNKPTIPVVPAMKPLVAGNNVSIVEGTDDVTISATAAPQLQANWNETSTSSVQFIQNKPTIPTLPTMKPLVAGSNVTITEGVNDVTIAASGGGSYTAGPGIAIANDVISRRVQLVSTNDSYAFVRGIIDSGDLPVLDVANGSMHDLYVCTMYRGSDIQFVGSAYGQTTLYTLASNSTWTSQILEPQILQSSANKVLSVNSAGTNAEWRSVREVPTYAVADAGKLLQVVNDGGVMQLAWGQPTGYWTQSVYTSTNHSVTADEALNGYFDLFLSVTASDTSSAITSPAFVAMTWDLQWSGGATSSRVSSIDFAIGVSGVSYKALFTDSSPAHETHKDWGMTDAWILGTRYDSIRVRVNLTGASDGDNFQLYAGGMVTQVR